MARYARNKGLLTLRDGRACFSIRPNWRPWAFLGPATCGLGWPLRGCEQDVVEFGAGWYLRPGGRSRPRLMRPRGRGRERGRAFLKNESLVLTDKKL